MRLRSHISHLKLLVGFDDRRISTQPRCGMSWADHLPWPFTVLVRFCSTIFDPYLDEVRRDRSLCFRSSASNSASSELLLCSWPSVVTMRSIPGLSSTVAGLAPTAWRNATSRFRSAWVSWGGRGVRTPAGCPWILVIPPVNG